MLPASAYESAGARAVSGVVAYSKAKAPEQQQAERVDKDSSALVQTAGGKTFHLREGVWTDAEFKLEARLPVSDVKFGSENYFAPLKQKPRLAAFFALGEKVVVVFEGRVYRVTSQ